MKKVYKKQWLTFFILTCFSLSILLPMQILGEPLPNVDELFGTEQADRLRQRQQSLKRQIGAHAWVDSQRTVHVESVLGIPTFVQMDLPQTKKLRSFHSSDSKRNALADLSQLASLYRLKDDSFDMVEVAQVHDKGEGPIIVKLQQKKDGIDVFRHEMNLLYDREQQLRAVSGFLSPYSPSATQRASLTNLSPREVIEKALGEFGESSEDFKVDFQRQDTLYAYFDIFQAESKKFKSLQPARIKKTYFLLPTHLEMAYYLELEGLWEGKRVAHSYVYSANNGRLLFRNNQIAHQSFTYKVYADPNPPHLPYANPYGYESIPHPTGEPSGYQPTAVPQNLISLSHAGVSTNDPWLPENATTLHGNHVEVDPFSPLVVQHPTATDGAFSFTFDPEKGAYTESIEQYAAAQTQVFYVSNFLHDWFYDVGFDEEAGNAQHDNYARGGEAGDQLLIDRFPWEGAWISVPADGASPSMSLGIFSGWTETKIHMVSPSPETIDAESTNHGASFEVTGNVVQAKNEAGEINHGCSSIGNGEEITGNILYLKMHDCPYPEQLLRVFPARPSAIIMGNVLVNGYSAPLSLDEYSSPIPIVSTSDAQSQVLAAQLEQGPVRLTVRQSTKSRDSMVDATVVVHEYGHYISSRLIGNGNGLTNSQGSSMGEGWSDFLSLLLLAPPYTIPNEQTYAVGSYFVEPYVTNPYYSGIRRYPYSTDFDKNPLSFRHVEDDVEVPKTSAFPSSSGKDNSEVHNSGEVWANVLWESYVALNTRWNFSIAQNRMKRYFIESLKLTPIDPTFTEARDALLAAVNASDAEDHVLIEAAFNRRGFGPEAVSPERSDRDHIGTVEHFPAGHLVVEEMTLASHGEQCDVDQVFDPGESMLLSMTFKNIGSGTLENTLVKLNSPEGVQLSRGGIIELPEIAPSETVTVSTFLRLVSSDVGALLPIELVASNDQVSVPNKKEILKPRVNYDLIPASTFDDAETGSTGWRTENNVASSVYKWERSQPFPELSLGYHGKYRDGEVDMRLISPPIQVADTGDFRISFDHLYSFDWEEGSVEFRIDGGEWQDMGTYLETGTYSYSEFSTGFYDRELETETIDVGTLLSGQTIELAFHIISYFDFAYGFGWFIDNIRLENIDNLPFTTLEENDQSCSEVHVNYQDGWTLTALPTDASVSANQFDNVFADTQTVWQWKDNQWFFHTQSPTQRERYLEAGVHPLEGTIEPGEGMWVSTQNSGSIPFSAGDSYDMEQSPLLTKAPSGWTLLGTATALSPESLSNDNPDLRSIWVWRDRWYAYAADPALQKALQESGMRLLESILAGEGFWIQKY